MDFDKLMSFAADVQVDKVRNKFKYEKSSKNVNILVDDKLKKGKGINSPSVQAFLKKQEQKEKHERYQDAGHRRKYTGDRTDDQNAEDDDDESTDRNIKTVVVTGIRQRVGASSGVSSSKRALDIMSKKPPPQLATNSCLVKAENSAKHTARFKAETEKKKFVSDTSKSKHRKHKKHHRDKEGKDSVPSPSVPVIRKPNVPIKKKRGVPPKSFDEILKLAKNKDSSDNKRPMTQEEKDREERKKSKSYTDWLKYGSMSGHTPDGVANENGLNHRKPSQDVRPLKRKSLPPARPDSASLFKADNVKSKLHRNDNSTSSNHGNNSISRNHGNNSTSRNHANNSTSRNHADKPTIKKKVGSSNGRTETPQRNRLPVFDADKRAKAEKQRRETEELLKRGGASLSHSKSEPKLTNKSSAPAQSTWDRITGHMKKSGEDSQRKKKKKCHIISDESEYSEMSDFLDDSNENIDVSSHIRNIFGYDRNKFINESSDTRGMVTGFHQQIKEENKSLLLAKKEDLDDVKADERYYKNKAERLKRRR